MEFAWRRRPAIKHRRSLCHVPVPAHCDSLRDGATRRHQADPRRNADQFKVVCSQRSTRCRRPPWPAASAFQGLRPTKSYNSTEGYTRGIGTCLVTPGGYCALSSGETRTNFGWTFYLDRPAKERTLRNWPIQSHGAEILHLTCIWGSKYGLKLLAPVHDAELAD